MKIAIVGNPNCGKTALFNVLTGGKSKVGNYSGVTVEKKEGKLKYSKNLTFKIVDLPGCYSLTPSTIDEQITQNVLCGGGLSGLIAVVDAVQLERGLAFVLELKKLNIPIVLVLNMMDLAKKKGIIIDREILSKELNVPVVPLVATRKSGILELIAVLGSFLNQPTVQRQKVFNDIRSRFSEVERILSLAFKKKIIKHSWTDKIDNIVLHPVFGGVILFVVLSFVFQVIFTWAEIPMQCIELGFDKLAEMLTSILSVGPLQSLLVDGVLSGVGSVLVFLPQILLLFLLISFLEDSGYLPRAAFLMDRLMRKVGLHGLAFIPLLTSFACAIPGILSTRTIANRRDRLTTILIAPLMPCSARLPVYSLLIAAFIPNKTIIWPIRLQGVVLLSLYVFGAFTGLMIAFFFRKVFFRGESSYFLTELPTYKWPNFRNIGISLWGRALLFIRGAGTVILSVSVILWFLSSYPKPPRHAVESSITYSFAGRLGKVIEPFFSPIGFNWKIAVALIPGFSAREVMIGSLATVYSVEGRGRVSDSDSGMIQLLAEKIKKEWSIATALSLLTWYILSCQCVSTLVVTFRETGSFMWPAFMLFYMSLLAYCGSWMVYRFAIFLGF